MTTGQHLKNIALDDLEARRADLVLRGRRALLLALLEHGTATADDIRERVHVPEDIDPKALGAVPRLLANLKIIEAGGYVSSRRSDAHARPIRLWHLVNAAAALQWLADHPEPEARDLPLFQGRWGDE
ncbi:MAG: hypothetical protein JJU36_17940 [Phycisphaeraceae bacterium]|nr:hypothetical protein [Phycisphaeraceae bacterium]